MATDRIVPTLRGPIVALVSKVIFKEAMARVKVDHHHSWIAVGSCPSSVVLHDLFP